MKDKNTVLILSIILAVSVILNIYFYTKQTNIINSLNPPGNGDCSCDWSGCHCSW